MKNKHETFHVNALKLWEMAFCIGASKARCWFSLETYSGGFLWQREMWDWWGRRAV